MERETKEIITPVDKHKVVLNAWITGREKRELRNVFLSKMKVGKAETETNPAVLTDEAENKAITMIVVSVDGVKDKIIDKILDMKGKDYDFVIKEINKVSRETDFLV